MQLTSHCLLKMPNRLPKQWLVKMIKQLRKQYVGYTDEELIRIAAGIWYHRFSKKDRERITKQYEK